MTRNRKGRAGGNQASPNTSKRTRDFTGLTARLKAVIVAVWTAPVAVADWLINLGGLRDD